MPRILLIDDDPMIRMIVERVLEKEDTQVDTAADGGEGLEKARQHRPDLILCDLDMPVMDGMETLAQLRRDPVLGSVPFVLVTGAASETDEKRMVACGADGILRKPFPFASLQEIVRVHLGQPPG